jgi:hypothetical protein
MKKRSEDIRKNIGSLIYEQQLFQQAGNDDAVERTDGKIQKLRSQLLLVEQEENACHSVEEDQG